MNTKIQLNEGAARKYAFLMVRYKLPSKIQNIQDKIPSDILYRDDNSPNDYGKETDHHVTLAACLENDVDLDQVKKHLKPLKDYVAYAKGVSLFRNQKYDVIKCDIISPDLVSTNKDIMENFISHSEYKNQYQPHLTLAYVEKGQGSSFEQNFDRLIELTPVSFLFSWFDNGQEKQETFEN